MLIICLMMLQLCVCVCVRFDESTPFGDESPHYFIYSIFCCCFACVCRCRGCRCVRYGFVRCELSASENVQIFAQTFWLNETFFYVRRFVLSIFFRQTVSLPRSERASRWCAFQLFSTTYHHHRLTQGTTTPTE